MKVSNDPERSTPILDEFLLNFLEKQGKPETGWFCDIVGGMLHLAQPGPYPTARLAIDALMYSFKS